MSINEDVYENLAKKYDIIVPKGWYGFSAPKGWANLIEILLQDLIKLGWDRTLHQCKDKFGGLRFYSGSANDSDEIQERIKKAELESFKVCEICGGLNADQFTPNGWTFTFCSKHVAKAKESLKKYNPLPLRPGFEND